MDIPGECLLDLNYNSDKLFIFGHSSKRHQPNLKTVYYKVNLHTENVHTHKHSFHLIEHNALELDGRVWVLQILMFQSPAFLSTS